jgi:DNA-binding transcriptional LysR family regulator
MELYQLKTFYYVASLLNFSKAAEKLALTQPAVSRQIESLENHFGLPLFYRARSKVKLTDAGRHLLRYAERLLALSEETEKAMFALKNLEDGELIVGAGTTIGNYVISPLLVEFKKLYPNIRVTLKISPTSIIIDAMKNGIIDVAIVAKDFEYPDFYFQPLIRDELLLVVDKHHPLCNAENLSLTDLSNENFFLRPQGSHTREFVDHLFASQKFSPQNIFEFDTNEAIKQAIMKGLGIGFLSAFTVRTEIEHKLLFPIRTDCIYDREFSIIHPKSNCLSPATLQFSSFLKKNIGRFA